MTIGNTPAADPMVQLSRLLADSQQQSGDMAEKIMKLNALQQVDVSQLEYMGNLVDMYV